MTEKLRSPEGIGARLAAARKHLRLTQKDMAIRLGVTLRTYARFEADEGDLDAKHLIILTSNQIDLVWLLTGQGQMTGTTPMQSQTQTINLPEDGKLLGQILDGISALYREEGARLADIQRGIIAAPIYTDLLKMPDETDRRGALRYALEQLRKELRRAATDPGSSKLQA